MSLNKTLYNYSNTGKAYEWSIDLEKMKDGSYKMSTHHGQKDGKKVTHTKIISKGKASRSILEQATLEANSKWKKKHDKDGYRPSLDAFKSNTEIKKRVVIRPMLASKFTFESLTKKSRAKNIVLPCYIQRKFDGIRCLSHLNEDGDVIMETRTGVLIENFKNIRVEIKKTLLKMPKCFYLDGELFTLKIPFEKLNGLIRKTADKTLPSTLDLIDKIDYMVFDCFNINDLSMSFQKRYEIIEKIFKSKFKYLYKAEIYKVSSSDEIKKYHEIFIKEKHEGSILRNIEAPYELNKRSKNLQKLKTMQDAEFQIIGFTEGTGSDKGNVIWKCVTKKGKEFMVVPNGTRKFRADLFKNGKKYIGKQLTVVFQDYSIKGVPRFPRGKTIRENT